MSLLEELFGVDEAEEAEALERVIEGGIDEDDDERENGDDEAEEERRVVDPTKPKSVRVVKHPRLVLNAARLTGPRGMQTLPEHFQGFKFKGKGHEKEDLDMVLKKLEHWAHRLYPKFQFADCLKKIETLGNKRPVQVTLRKIRSDQMLSSDVVTQRDSSDDETPAPPEEDEFDKMLQQQIELARATPRTPGGVRTPSLAPRATSSPSISEEQKQRMLRNRQLAEERKRRKNAPEANMVDLTGFNQQVPASFGRTEQVQLTGDEQPADVTKSTTVEEVDLTGLDHASVTVNPVTINENVIDMTHETNVTVENDQVTKPKKKTKKNAIIDSSDDEGNNSDKSEKYNDTNDRPEPKEDTEGNKHSSSDDRDPVSLHYSDSSDEENTTANISITADVHRDMFSQTTQNESEQRSRQNGHPSEEDTETLQEAIQIQPDIETDLETDKLTKSDDIESQTIHSTMDVDSIMKEIEYCDEENTMTDTNLDDDW